MPWLSSLLPKLKSQLSWVNTLHMRFLFWLIRDYGNPERMLYSYCSTGYTMKVLWFTWTLNDKSVLLTLKCMRFT